MTPGLILAAIVIEKAARINDLVAAIRNLPLADYEEFIADARTPAAAESYLRRALESLLDLGRHLLAKLCHSGAGIQADCRNAGSAGDPFP